MKICDIPWYNAPWWADAYIESHNTTFPSGWVWLNKDDGYYYYYPEYWLRCDNSKYPDVKVKREWEAKDSFTVHYEPKPADNQLPLPNDWIDPEERTYAEVLRQVDFSLTKEGATHFLVDLYMYKKNASDSPRWKWRIYWVVPTQHYTEYWLVNNYQNERVFVSEESVNEMRMFPVDNYGVGGLKLTLTIEEMQERADKLYQQFTELTKLNC